MLVRGFHEAVAENAAATPDTSICSPPPPVLGIVACDNSTGAVQETGAAVINGAMSTLIAALCLSGSGSYVFITFFYALLFIVLCGAFQGLVVLPVLLDIFKPAAHIDVLSDADIVRPDTESEGADS